MSANKPKTTGEGSGTGDGKMADENMELDERKFWMQLSVIILQPVNLWDHEPFQNIRI